MYISAWWQMLDQPWSQSLTINSACPDTWRNAFVSQQRTDLELALTRQCLSFAHDLQKESEPQGSAYYEIWWTRCDWNVRLEMFLLSHSTEIKVQGRRGFSWSSLLIWGHFSFIFSYCRKRFFFPVRICVFLLFRCFLLKEVVFKPSSLEIGIC